MEKIRAGVIGAGYFAREMHLPALKSMEEIEVVAACRRNEEKLKKFAADFDIPHTYTDYNELLEKEPLDAVYVLVSAGAMFEVASAVLEKGIPAVFEKPPGKTVEEARKLADLADETGTPHILAFNRRHSIPVRRARELLDEKGVRPRQISAKMLRYRRYEQGFTMGTAVHAIDTLRFLGGEVEEVESTAAEAAEKGGTNLVSTLHYESGAIGALVCQTVAGVSREEYEIHGKDVSLFLRVPQGGFSGATGGFTFWDGPTYPLRSENSEMQQQYLEIKPRLLTGVYEEDADLVRVIREGWRSPNSLRDGLKTMLLAEAINKGGRQKVEKD